MAPGVSGSEFEGGANHQGMVESQFKKMYPQILYSTLYSQATNPSPSQQKTLGYLLKILGKISSLEATIEHGDKILHEGT